MQHFGTFSEILKQFCIKANAVFSFLNVLYEKNALKWRIIISGNTSSEKGKQGMACAFNRITPHASTVTQAICISANLVHYFTLAAAYLSLLFLRLTFSAWVSLFGCWVHTVPYYIPIWEEALCVLQLSIILFFRDISSVLFSWRFVPLPFILNHVVFLEASASVPAAPLSWRLTRNMDRALLFELIV